MTEKGRSEEINSPPYPGDGATADVLYNHLQALRHWVRGYREELNTEVGEQTVPVVKKLPDKQVYTVQSVLTQWHHLLLLRHIRKEWDRLVREFEHDWNCTYCIRQRAMLVQAAAVLLNGAFVPFEVREARRQQELDKIPRSFERLIDSMRKVMESDDDQQAEEEGRQENATS